MSLIRALFARGSRRCSLVLVRALFLLSPHDRPASRDARGRSKALVGNSRSRRSSSAAGTSPKHLEGDEARDSRRRQVHRASSASRRTTGRFTVDPAKKPKEMDVKPKDGPNKGKTVKAIYKLDGDTLVDLLRPRQVRESPDQVRVEGKDQRAAHHLQAREEVTTAPPSPDFTGALVMTRTVALMTCCDCVRFRRHSARNRTTAAADMKAMVGQWKIEKAELSAAWIAIAFVTGTSRSRSARGASTPSARSADQKDVGTFTVDRRPRSPRRMDIKAYRRPEQGQDESRAIYKLDGDTLDWSATSSGDRRRRPSKFETEGADTPKLLLASRTSARRSEHGPRESHHHRAGGRGQEGRRGAAPEAPQGGHRAAEGRGAPGGRRPRVEEAQGTARAHPLRRPARASARPRSPPCCRTNSARRSR